MSNTLNKENVSSAQSIKIQNKTDFSDKRTLSREKLTVSPPVRIEVPTNLANEKSKSPPKNFLVKPESYTNQFKVQNSIPTAKRNIPISPGPKKGLPKPKESFDSTVSNKDDETNTTAASNSK